jgi:hypothetical protein
LRCAAEEGAMPLPKEASYIYMLRAHSAGEAIQELANTVWYELLHVGVQPDPHRWSTLHDALRALIESRLTFHTQCGESEVCQSGIRPAYFVHQRREPSERIQSHIGPYYLMELRQNPEELAAAVTMLAKRLFSNEIKANRQTDAIRERLLVEIRKALSRRLFYNDRCLGCPVRQKPGEAGPAMREEEAWLRGRITLETENP